jgi:hypothetical protein
MIRTPYAVDTSISHGHKKHLSSSTTIREKIARDGAVIVWVNPINGRRARVCCVDRVFGIQIIHRGGDGTWQEITCFVKSKMTRLDQVKQYLKNTGYSPE